LSFKSLLQNESNAETRWEIATALAKCGGFSDDELAAAFEAHADMAVTVEGQKTVMEISSGESEKAPPQEVRIGQILCDSDMSWATEGFATILFDRLKEMRPGVAKLVLDKIRGLPLNIARGKL